MQLVIYIYYYSISERHKLVMAIQFARYGFINLVVQILRRYVFFFSIFMKSDEIRVIAVREFEPEVLPLWRKYGISA